MRAHTATQATVFGISPHSAMPLLTVTRLHLKRSLQGEGNGAHLHAQGAFIVILIELFKRFDAWQAAGDILCLQQEIPHDVAASSDSASLRESHGSSPDYGSKHGARQ